MRSQGASTWNAFFLPKGAPPEVVPSDADCHVTSRRGHTRAMEGRYYALVARSAATFARTEAPNWSLPRGRQSSVTLPPNCPNARGRILIFNFAGELNETSP